MKNAIILHGRPRKAEYYATEYPSMSNSHWLPWLQKQLLIRDIATVTPEIPLSFEPVWERWVKEIERYDIMPETILVGHSCGGGFWVRYISEHPQLRVGKVVLVAPWIDVEHADPNHFFSFAIDPDLAKRTSGLTLFHSTDDVKEIQASVRHLRSTLHGLIYKEFSGKGHFTHKYMPDDTFPELLDYLVAE
jgi:hypothetical protein